MTATETVTPVAAATDAAAAPTQRRGGRKPGTKSIPVLKFDSEDAARAAPKGNEDVRVYKAVLGDKTQYFTGNRRGAVYGAAAEAFGIDIVDLDAKQRGRGGFKVTPDKVEKALEEMDDATRQRLMAKFFGQGAFKAAAELPPAPAKRDDTTADFAAATKGNGATATAAKPAVRATATAGKSR